MAGEVQIAEDVAADRMDAEEGGLLPAGFDRDERAAPFPAGRVRTGAASPKMKTD